MKPVIDLTVSSQEIIEQLRDFRIECVSWLERHKGFGGYPRDIKMYEDHVAAIDEAIQCLSEGKRMAGLHAIWKVSMDYSY